MRRYGDVGGGAWVLRHDVRYGLYGTTLASLLTVAARRPVRRRILSIVVLGVITSALSLFALVRVLSITVEQRLERAREAVADEAGRLASSAINARGDVLASPAAASFIGMRGGYARAGSVPNGLPAAWRDPVSASVAASGATGAASSREASLVGATLVIATRPAASGDIAWAALLVQPPSWLPMWRYVVIALAAATALLVTSALYAVVTVRRGAAALDASLIALADDLSAPIPRPTVRELADVADGVASLAAKLARARATEERLGEELARKDRLAALGRVVAGVAHEIRNPLASIKLRLDLAAACDAVPDAVANAVAHASSEITRLDRLVADLLVVAGRSIGPRMPTSIGALARARADALALWAASRQVTIDVEGDASADVDSDSLARALDNLLRNAVEASSTDAVVVARVRATGAGAAAVTIEDCGPGVPEVRAAELFEPFFTTKGGGTGLGLAIARAIARAHGGDVVYAREGSLTRFELVVAASVAPVPGAVQKSPWPSS